MPGGEMDCQPRAFSRPADSFPDPFMNALTRGFAIRRHGLLDCLSFLAPDLLTGIPNPFAFVWLRRIEPANVRGHLANKLLVNAGDGDFRLIDNGDFNFFWNRK
jgi:hypothetical protein